MYVCVWVCAHVCVFVYLHWDGEAAKLFDRCVHRFPLLSLLVGVIACIRPDRQSHSGNVFVIPLVRLHHRGHSAVSDIVWGQMNNQKDHNIVYVHYYIYYINCIIFCIGSLMIYSLCPLL